MLSYNVAARLFNWIWSLLVWSLMYVKQCSSRTRPIILHPVTLLGWWSRLGSSLEPSLCVKGTPIFVSTKKKSKIIGLKGYGYLIIILIYVPSPYCRCVRSTLWPTVSLHAVAWKLSFTGTESPNPVPAWQCHGAQSKLHEHMVCQGWFGKKRHRALTATPLNAFGMNWSTDCTSDLLV